MEDSDSLSDLELEAPPKLTFDELRIQITNDSKSFRNKPELLRTLYYYCKDPKKQQRIVQALLWVVIVPCIQDKNNNKLTLFGLKALNQLISNEATHAQILDAANSTEITKKKDNVMKIKKAKDPFSEEELVEEAKYEEYQSMLKSEILKKKSPVKILVKIILDTESTLIMNEATKGIRILAKTKEYIKILMSERSLLSIIRTKFLDSDPQSQEFILETVSEACKYPENRQFFVEYEDIIEILMSQIKSISTKVTYQTLKICRQLSKDEGNLEKLQGEKLRLSSKLIYAYRWLEVKSTVDGNTSKDQQVEQLRHGSNIRTEFNQIDLIFREISKTFQYILKYYDVHKKLVNQASANGEAGENNTENEIIETIVQLGRSTKDPKTTLNAATSLAHITEILHCNTAVASGDAIDFMIDMLKDTKNLKHHRQGCRYFANLSFYKDFRDALIKKEIATFLLRAIESHLDEDTIKHSAIALANLSSHKDFMNQSTKAGDNTAQNSKQDKWKIKPLIHLLDSTKEGKINLIQSACITLCNMASKPSLHQHFVHEPEISTIKNCLANPIDKNSGNELTRFMIKLVCNLTKNPEILSHLSRKGFLEILFELLRNHEKEKEIFGNVVTAISYLSVQKECQEKIIKSGIIKKILEPLTQIHEVDQKLVVIALTSMLFNGIELQKEFIENGGLGKLLFFMQQKDKIFQQLACKCFSLLSENQDNLQRIIDDECLNTIIISCLRTKDIDLETLKEITKIFINLILWRKLKKETIETTCYLCDIGLMIKDLDMNILAIFCLNALSENEQSHQYIKKSQIEDGNAEDINSQSSIFSRINYLLEVQEQKQDDKQDPLKQELLIILITSFYLNLARNEENLEFLLNLKLFKRLNSLMQSLMISQVQESTALCYTNTIFAKLLKNQKSRKQCIEEEGYKLFISILKSTNNKHLFLETLDSIKLFLTKREYLSKFQSIPEFIQLNPSCQDLNVSFLQVLAILSFEKSNHEALKSINFIDQLQERNMFETVFSQFDEMVADKKKEKFGSKGKQGTYKQELISDLQRHQQSMDLGDSKKKKKKRTDDDKQIELALAISIILANLSSEDDFIQSLLGVSKWVKKDAGVSGGNMQIDNFSTNSYKLNPKHELKEDIDDDDDSNDSSIDHDYDLNSSTVSHAYQMNDDYDDNQLKDLEEVKRITRLLNLLSHENPFISEQISILLANVSNSQYFRHIFITDRCMKAVIKILRFDRKSKPTEVSLLAILIGVLNLSSLKDTVRGIENMKFLASLEEIIKNREIPYVNKSIGLLAISNIYTLSKNVNLDADTRDFAFKVLQNWKAIQEEEKENTEVVKNLVYSALILFYNLILKKSQQKETIEKLIPILTDHILSFEDAQIINVVLELITLFSRETNTANLIFDNMQILKYAFSKLKSDQKDTMRLSSLALSRLAARLVDENCELFIENLKDFKDFEKVVDNIKNAEQADVILKYFLNFLENITSFKKTRDELDCPKLFESTMQLYQDKISLENKVSLINIMFNLNFNLTEPRKLSREFLKLLYKTYKDENLKDDEKTQRKIIVLVVSASSLEENHENIIKCNFYTQFKRNINDLYDKLVETNEEVELFGLVNIALNKKFMHLIYQDLKKVHKIALKNPKIDFKTKVDLFSECSKFLAKISSQSPEKAAGTEKDTSDTIDHCLKALLFSLIQLITLLDETKFQMFKYFLTAILDCTKNLKHHLIYLIKIDHLLDFLQQVLTKDYVFNMGEFDDQVLRFSLRVIVCEIFFNLKFERNFYKRDNVTDSIKLLINFAQKVITMNIEKKMTLVSNTLRLLSQMIASIHLTPQAHEKVLKTNAVEFVKEALTLSKDLQPCINIDALFCLTNMMNIKELALDPSLLNVETVNNALIIYFAYNHQVELDECIITFLYSISKYHEYQLFMKDKSKVLFFLMDKHLDASKEGYKESCRKKIFSTVHNMTENEDICKQLNVSKFIQLTNKMLKQTDQNMYSADHIHELALKSLINMCRHTTESLEEANLKELFSGISNLYSRFKSLSKQYSLRLITILTKQWNAQKIEEYLEQIVDIISQFIERCDSIIEMKLVLLNLERISCFKKLMKSLAETQCEPLIRNISNFMAKNINKQNDYANSIEQLLKFCKKLSKQSKAHEHLVNYKIHEISLEYIAKAPSLKLDELGDKPLRQHLTAIQNVMKMVKNIYEGQIPEEKKQEIVAQVESKEQVINVADDLLQSHQNNDDLAIMIVNIIICFHSISKEMEAGRVKTWVSNFSNRLVESAKPDFQKKNARSWYMEKYVFIIELLVTKNLERIEKDITEDILQILDIDQTYFTKTIWYKLIKILAHLQYLQEISSQGTLENIFKFIITAYEKANENLCFYYFMKVILLIIKKVDNNALFKASKFYQLIFGNCVTFLKNNYQQKDDALVLEILLYLIDFFKFLMNFQLLHQLLNSNEIVFYFIEMLQIHENNYILKALSQSLQDVSKTTIFYPDLLNDHSLNVILQKMVNGVMESKSLDNLYECFRTILVQTKVPVKYLVAQAVLRITESKLNWKEKEESNIVTVLKLLCFNIKSLEDTSYLLNQQENGESFSDLSKKALKYSLIAITNILIKSSPEHIFNRRLTLLQLLLDNSNFEQDSQMNLRFLYLLFVSLDKNNGKDIQSTLTVSLINFLLSNIHKFRSVLQMKESYVFEIPSQKQQQQLQNVQETPTVNSKPRQGQNQGVITVGGFDNVASQIKQVDSVQSQTSQVYQQFPSQPLDVFFFENDEYDFRKIDGIRLSLCMTVKILYKISTSKKKTTCQQLLENELSTELFKFFTPYIEYHDQSCLKQIKQVIKIIKNCAEFIQLHPLLLQKDSVINLIKVAERALNDDFLPKSKPVTKELEEAAQEQKRSVILPILRTFIFLCSTPEFHWHLTKYNALDLLNRMREKDDEKINDVAREVCEKVIDHIDDSLLVADQDFQNEIENILPENQQKQLKTLQGIETILIQKKVKLDKIGNNELEYLLKVLQQRVNEKDVSSDLLQVKKIILTIINFVYSSRFLKESHPHTFHYKLDHVTEDSYSHNNQSIDQEQKRQSMVYCIVEKEEMFQTLMDLVNNNSNFSDLYPKMVEFINFYTQSTCVKEECLLEYVLPLYSKILGEQTITVQSCNLILESLIRLFKNQEMCLSILSQYDIPGLLNTVIANESFAQNESIFLNLELAVKLVYYNPIKISKSSEVFIKTLLEYQGQPELNRLGLYSLYCISLALQEPQYAQNIHLFFEDSVLKGIFSFISVSLASSVTTQVLKRHMQQKINNEHTNKLKVIAIQVLVNVLEHIQSDIEDNKPHKQANLKMSNDLIYKIYIEYGLIKVLLKVCLQTDSSEEKKLAARGFACLPHTLIYELNPEIDLRLKESSETFTLMNYFQSINYVLRAQDAESTYFVLYSLLNFINNLELSGSEQQHPMQSMRETLAKITLNQIDYQTLCLCLIKTQLLSQIMLLPQKVSDEDVIRVCLKLLITIMFKGSTQKILFFNSPGLAHTQTLRESNPLQHMNKSSLSNDGHKSMLWEQLGVQIDGERERSREQLRNMIQKLQTFELSQIHQGGYVQFLHLISQVILTTTGGQNTPQAQEERHKILPPSSVMAEIVKKVCNQVNEKEIFKILSGDDAKNQKLLLYKFFFFNYMLSVILPDVLQASQQPPLNGTEGENLKDLPDKIFKYLALVLDSLKDKTVNKQLDSIMVSKQPPQKAFTKTNNHEESKDMGSPQIDENTSTTLSIQRLVLFNLEIVLKETIAVQTARSISQKQPSYYHLSESMFETIVTLLQDYEDNGDIIETCYQILDLYLQATKWNSQHDNVTLMESSKGLLAIGIKHTAVYQCEQSYNFLKSLISLSEKYKKKPEIEQALASIIPPSLKHQQTLLNRSMNSQTSTNQNNNNNNQSKQ